MALTTGIADLATGSFVTLQPDDAGGFTVPKADQLFGAEFQRSGPDLLLINEGAPTLVLPGYFATQTPADIHAPNGAVLKGHLVETLAGPEAPGQYAQAGATAPAIPIGQVESLDGTGSVRRVDGSTEALSPETRIFLGDLIETDAGSGVSLTFVDGTIFSLSANARMVIDELIYDPDASDNGATFNLIQGGFVFIAGQIAPSGGIDIATPTSTMGIRGTTVLINISTLNGLVTVEVSLLQDPDGSVGRVALFDLDGVPIADLTTTDTKWIITSDGTPPQEVIKTALDIAQDAPLIAAAFAAFDGASARAEGGGAFVTSGPPAPAPTQEAPSLTPPLQPGTSPQDSEPAAPGADTPAPSPPPPPASDGDVLEEGNLQPQPGSPVALPDVKVAGLEDAPGAGISGQVALPLGAPPSFVVVAQPANGSVTFDPNGGFSYAPNPNFSGQDSFVYQFTDANGVIQTGTVGVLVQPVNDAPSAVDASVALSEDGTFAGVLSGSDPDGDPLFFAVAQAPQNGSVALSPGGTYVYTPTADFAGQDSFTYTVTDLSGLTSTGTVTVLVADVNDPPVLTTPPSELAATVSEDALVAATGTLVAQDVDPGETLVWTGTANGAFGQFTVDATSGTWSYLPGVAAQALDIGDSVLEQFTVSVSDGVGDSAQQIVSITLIGANDAPVVGNVLVQSADGSTVFGQLSAFDPDASSVVTFAEGPLEPENGQLSISPDGAFAYIPDAGFAGVDSFTYQATDGEGGVSVATVTVLVEDSSQTGPGGQVVTLGIDPSGTAQTVPGTVQISQTPATAPAVNIAVLLDWSGSVGAADIATMVSNASQALQNIAAKFAGSETQVDVHLVALSPSGFLQQTFDVQDAALTGALASYDFMGEAFPLSLSVTFAETFFKSEPLGEENYLYVVTPADATDATAAAALTAVQDAAANGFDVALEAFIYGDAADAGTLAILGSAPTILTGPEAISDLATPVPVFAADLVDLSIRLFADGVDQGEIADEASAGLVDTGNGASLDLSQIAGVEALLGSENIVTVAAGFDLDGDPTTTELTLFSSESLDPISGAPAPGGRSVVEFGPAGDLTQALQVLSRSSDIEVVDMDNAQENALTLFGQDVLGLSDRPDALLEDLLASVPDSAVTVYGNPGDELTLASSASGTFAPSTEGPVDDGEGSTLALYSLSDASGVLATVAVDAEVAVTLAAAQSV